MAQYLTLGPGDEPQGDDENVMYRTPAKTPRGVPAAFSSLGV
jgi:hypothetical protein